MKADSSRVGPGGLVTVAYMKARLDEGQDQLGIFMPLVFDVLPTLSNTNFLLSDVQKALQSIHGVLMPQQTIGTLLRRACRQDYIVRESGAYRLNIIKPLPASSVSREKSDLEQAQMRLGEALKSYAQTRSLVIDSQRSALDLILCFLQEQQVALLLGSAPTNNGQTGLAPRESGVVAEFLSGVIANAGAHATTLRFILEGLVLYHAAFLPDLSYTDKRFNELTVVFDSNLVRQALGYEGSGPGMLVRETIDLLQASGVRCIVFDKTVQEIHRILRVYEDRLATQRGRRSLRAYPMARHFITERYSPSDVQEMSALLEPEIAACGLKITPAPERLREFTHSEAKLAARLTKPSEDSDEPRVVHDVDCVAGVLTLRRNHRAARIEEARAIFVTTSELVIINTTAWWESDEHESGVPPVVHARSLANLAWLKRPSISADYQIRDLVVLCSAAMRPSPKTWQRFLVHLDKLQSSGRLSPDQATAIMVSGISDRFLRDAELDNDDELDAGTLDEVVDRVIGKYELEANTKAAAVIEEQQRHVSEARTAAETRIAEAQASAEARVRSAQESLGNVAEILRRRELVTDGRCRTFATLAAGALYWLMAGAGIAGASALGFSDFAGKGWRLGLAAAVVIFVALELIGMLSHLRRLRDSWRASLQQRFREWFLSQGDFPTRKRTPTIGSERL